MPGPSNMKLICEDNQLAKLFLVSRTIVQWFEARSQVWHFFFSPRLQIMGSCFGPESSLLQNHKRFHPMQDAVGDPAQHAVSANL